MQRLAKRYAQILRVVHTKIMQNRRFFVQNFETYAKICEKWEIIRKTLNYAILCENLENMRFSHISHNRIICDALIIGSRMQFTHHVI